jgi:hypothetical protein
LPPRGCCQSGGLPDSVARRSASFAPRECCQSGGLADMSLDAPRRLRRADAANPEDWPTCSSTLRVVCAARMLPIRRIGRQCRLTLRVVCAARMLPIRRIGRQCRSTLRVVGGSMTHERARALPAAECETARLERALYARWRARPPYADPGEPWIATTDCRREISSEWGNR